MKRTDRVQIIEHATREIEESHDILDLLRIPREIDGEKQSLSQRVAMVVASVDGLWKMGRALEHDVRKVEMHFDDLMRRLEERRKSRQMPTIYRGPRNDPDTDLRDDWKDFY